ncbi:hypothetical protein AJ80_00883 [Polytolypa hystricis UAMH7299]|uniref:Large ribosomal subunit protein uL2m n=1 Tax=Polytolypa hystricis (strain UAMH7299) TaxID=1447883 RepID=A0A2B7Z1D8_POLH7|nr:hypothetical protein AJ80_00883 [Polytolypa hystricis UAMH7299]
MLQPRAALGSLRNSCKCLSSLAARSFTTVLPLRTQAAVSAAPETDVTFAPPPAREKGGIQLRTYRPITPGLRHLRRPLNTHLWKGRPVHRLTFPKKGHGKGGRNNTGRITVRHRGGGHKRRIRVIDFTRAEPGPHEVERIEHDPGRTAHIALLKSKVTKTQSYIVAAEGMREGDVVESYMAGIPKDLWETMGGAIDPGVLAARTAWRGNCLPLHMVPVGTIIFNVGLRKGGPAQLCRSAGTFATVISKPSEEDLLADRQARAGEKPLIEAEKEKIRKLAQFVTIRLASGEVRRIHRDCCSTVGVASNADYQYTQLGKAGRKRWLNIRPTVRGLAMNAKDHPHGGGRGKSKGNVHPKSPWGLPAKGGYKTRPKWRVNKAVVTPRPRNQGKRRRGYN